jgi:ABC-type uncharacterized transport system involved in gliding motility auxiliary subunit
LNQEGGDNMQTAIFALLGVASLLAGFVFRLVMPGLRYYAWGILALGVALLAAGAILDFRKVRGALGSKRGKFGIGTTVKISLFCGIILLINAVSVGTFYRFDFTGLAQFTLTSQTKEVLAELDEPVEIVNFFTPALPAAITGYARDLLDEYQNYTDQLTVREIDPELNPDQARQYGIAGYGALYGELGGITVLSSAEGQRHVFGLQIYAEAEHAFTSAILEVTGTLQKKVYFLTGHGESRIASDYLDAKNGLRDNLFQVAELDLLRVRDIPSDAGALIIAGPQQDLGTNELEILKEYLVNGGRLFVLLNPNPPERLKALLAEWWVDVQEGTIIDPSSYVAPNQDTPLIPRTGNQLGLVEVYFPGAASLLPLWEGLPEGIELSPLVWTSGNSWLELSEFSEKGPKFDKETEIKGVNAIGVFVSTVPEEGDEESTGTRIVVIGDSDFAANQHFQNGNNSDLFLSSINWLTEGEEIISVDRKVLPIRRLILDPEEERFLHISSIGLLPLLLLLAGGYVWWRRRK